MAWMSWFPSRVAVTFQDNEGEKRKRRDKSKINQMTSQSVLGP